MAEKMTEGQQRGYNRALERIKEVKDTNAEYLDLADIGLIQIPPELFELKHLESLNLDGNNLSILPAEIGQLTSLRWLSLESNLLTSIPVEIGQLTDMYSLILDGNLLVSVPADIGLLTSLEILKLMRNQLTILPAEIGELNSLQLLNLDYNRLGILPAEIGKLTNLQTLCLSYNQLKELPQQITELKMDFPCQGKTWGSKGLSLYGNPLEIPPIEIVEKGKAAIKNYFDSLEQAAKTDDVVRLYEGKLLIVGEGDVGKTFLANQLMYGKQSDGGTTEGIDIHKWMINTANINDFRVNLWDFAGQAICHATHQFFLTKRSLYIFVWEARSDQDIANFDYWLNIIKLLSNDAPVIMAMNKCDERSKAIDQATIQKEFPNVIGFYEISAMKGIGIEQLRQRIYQEMEALPMVGKKLARQWVDIRNKLESMKKQGYITYQQYVHICGEYKLNVDQAANLAQYYHDLGVILHFKDDDVLSNIVVLNAEWATDAVYAVVDNMDIQKAHGSFKHSELATVWTDYPIDSHLFLMELMKKFELSFQLPGKRQYIVPELLSPAMPRINWNKAGNLRFEYKYDFMPAGIITRFTVRQHEIIEDGLYWKNGVCLKWNNTRALIVCNPFGRTISINIKGIDSKGMLAIMRKEIEIIHCTLNYPKHDQRIPCICNACNLSDSPDYHSYEKIKKLIGKSKSVIQCDNGNDVSINRLLGEYGMSKQEEINQSNKYGGDTYNNTYYGDSFGGDKIGRDKAGRDINHVNIEVTNQQQLQEAFEALPQEVRQEIRQDMQEYGADAPEPVKLKYSEKIKAFLLTGGYSIAQSISASALYDWASSIQW